VNVLIEIPVGNVGGIAGKGPREGPGSGSLIIGLGGGWRLGLGRGGGGAPGGQPGGRGGPEFRRGGYPGGGGGPIGPGRGQVVEEGLVESDFAVWREEGEGDVVLASKKVGLESLVEPHKPVAGKVEVLEARLKLADQEEEVVEEAYLVGMGRKRVEVCFAVPVLKMDMWACVEVQKLPHFFSPSALSFGLFARFRPCLTPFSESAVHHSSPYG
jgi:hypothetical protein